MEEHKKRIIKAIAYIDNNLDADLSLEKMAEIAMYSSFHFHRILSSLPAKHSRIISLERK
ncbi:helix-turn-helix transcriptional regulator [Chryseobacterium oranimense]|uniref:helix-turn-helix transcriptional regulator n=1 Tax=Chryseobacterium oranimense TaxID=421058 RepID=UPI00069433E2|nr:helix-turn-helix transcriptional regulator [Chryseobacterium oranimense]